LLEHLDYFYPVGVGQSLHDFDKGFHQNSL
jgi:hypothetical protein